MSTFEKGRERALMPVGERCLQAREGQRERQRQDLKQVCDSREPDMGLKLMNLELLT